MPEQPLVTIITPSYNQGAYIRATIESVLSQDYPNIEYLVIDGGSTDETVNILREYEGRLTWVSEPDNGQSDAINKGFRQANGDILAWLNSDDIYLPGAVSESVAILQANGDVDLVYGDIQLIDANGAVIKTPVRSKPFSLKMLLTDFSTLHQQSAFFRRSIIDRVGLLNEQLHYFMDIELWMRIALAGQGKYHSGIRAQSRMHDVSKSVSQQSHFWRERQAVLNSFFERTALPPEVEEFRLEALAHCSLYLGENLLLESNHAEARPQIRFALRHHPRVRRRLLAASLLVDSYLGTRLTSFGRGIRDRVRAEHR